MGILLDRSGHPDEPVVRLCCATLPRPLHLLALHHWFVCRRPETGAWDRWEVWQDPDHGGESWGHVHRNLMAPERGVGGGPARVEREWRGEEAASLIRVLEDPLRYPFRERYRAWPGPNSNTYAVWALDQAALRHDFDPRAIGKDFLGRSGSGVRTGPDGWQAGCPLIGLKVAPRRAVELHLLCLTFGLEVPSLAVHTPFGRLRWAPPGRSRG